LSSSTLDIVLASSNPGKIKELTHLVSDLPINLRPQSDFDIEDAEETGLSFIENAIIKARHAAEKSGLMALADDSGLVVNALGGKPGIYSARYAGTNANAQNNIQKLLLELEQVPPSERQAKFVCVLALFHYPSDPSPLICQGEWEGEILLSPRGDNGFGYDPIFWVPTHQCSAAELSGDIKNKISHRAKAFRALHEAFF